MGNPCCRCRITHQKNTNINNRVFIYYFRAYTIMGTLLLAYSLPRSDIVHIRDVVAAALCKVCSSSSFLLNFYYKYIVTLKKSNISRSFFLMSSEIEPFSFFASHSLYYFRTFSESQDLVCPSIHGRV